MGILAKWASAGVFEITRLQGLLAPMGAAGRMNAIKELLKQPYWVIALVLGGALLALPCITVDKDFHFLSHPPTTYWPVGVGLALLLVSTIAFAFTLRSSHKTDAENLVGVDITRIQEHEGVISTTVAGCEIRVVNGRVEEFAQETGTVVALPCNEYFDDRCVKGHHCCV